MSSEREKLIEIWLDNAGERQYQFAFRNALLSAGYTILHNTSHTALELGKDIVAIAPDGRLMAYQLKGNPTGRLTISQYHDILSQLNALVYQPVSHPAVKAGTTHVPILVTNGEIHEDVLAAIASYNDGIKAALPKVQPLQTIACGQLLKLILDSADTLWPVDVNLQRNILNVLTAVGDNELPMKEYVEILSDVLKDKYSETAIPSVHLVTSILASNWIAHKNHVELIKMYVLLAVAAACYQARWKKQRSKDRRFIDEIVFDIRLHMRSFVDDLIINYGDRRPLVNRDAFAEFGYYHPRKKMISGLISVALLDQELMLDNDTRDLLRERVCKTKHVRFMVWEGLVPYCLAEFWALSNIQGTQEPDRRLFAVIRDILSSNGADSTQLHLPGPYYTLCEVVEWQYKSLLLDFRSDIDRDNHYRRSWFAEAIFYLLARRNYKSACKLLWPNLTKFIHARTRLPDSIHFGPARCDSAVAEDKIIDVTSAKNWNDVVTEASANIIPLIPPQLLERPILTLLYCLFVPYRMNCDIILWLDRVFCKSWY
jgi:hypothetical protein